ncbi:MAG: hypothetical protein KDD82_08880 [Planctomycetes bacterium]|nr:hypothetical protein [Planctomycetota bacterium]
MALSPRAKRRLIALALALVLSPLLVLLLGESYVRLRHPAYADLWGAIRSHPVWVRELRPGASGRMRALTREYDHGYAINAQGLREAADLGPKDPAKLRVLAVGDSNTFGLGVEDEEVWVQALDDARTEALNAGWASGYAPDTACLFLEGRLDELQPDLVIQQLTPDNDLEDLAWRSQWQLDEAGALVAIKHRYDAIPDAIQALAFPRFLTLQVLPAWRGPPPTEQASDEPVALSAQEELGLERLRTVLTRTQGTLAGRGVKLVLLVFPSPRVDPETHTDARVRALAQLRRERILALLAELGLEVWDPTDGPELAAAAGPTFYGDGHMTAAGNAAIGAYAKRRLSAWREAR